MYPYLSIIIIIIICWEPVSNKNLIIMKIFENLSLREPKFRENIRLSRKIEIELEKESKNMKREQIEFNKKRLEFNKIYKFQKLKYIKNFDNLPFMTSDEQERKERDDDDDWSERLRQVSNDLSDLSKQSVSNTHNLFQRGFEEAFALENQRALRYLEKQRMIANKTERYNKQLLTTINKLKKEEESLKKKRERTEEEEEEEEEYPF